MVQPAFKLGVFDSGLGGVMIARSIRDALPDIDMVYLGDTMHVPYGNRSAEAIYAFCVQAMNFLFREANCNLVVMACNTASASALRRLQQEYLPKYYPNRRILGVVVPTIEYALDQGYKRLGLIGTNFTVSSNVYEEELTKIDPDITIKQVRTPLLVPLIEHEGEAWLDSVLDHYLKPLLECNIDALILSCTHYVYLKDRIRERYNVDVISQDEIVPIKLNDYLDRHPELETHIGRNGSETFYVTDFIEQYNEKVSAHFGGARVTPQPIELGKVA